MVNNLPASAGDVRAEGSALGQEDPLEEGVATHSSVLVWRIRGQRSLVGYSPCGRRELDRTEATQPACTDCVLTLHARLEGK